MPIRILLLYFIALSAGAVSGQGVETLEEAKTLSSRQGLPILLEFVVSD